MPASDVFGRQPTDDSSRWKVPVAPRMLTFADAVQGGSAFGATIDVMETVVARPVIWASAQFLRHAGANGTLDIDVNVPLAGRQTTQARACTRIDGIEVLSAWAAFGSRVFDGRGMWASPPDVAATAEQGPDILPSVGDGRLADHLDVRLARGRVAAELDGSPGTGRWAAWCRFADHEGAHSAAELAVFGDLVILAFADTLGRPCTGNSLDNSLRVVRREETDWILLDVCVDAIENGFGHACAHLWTENGTLLAIAGQTLVLRDVASDGRAPRRGRRIVGDRGDRE